MAISPFARAMKRVLDDPESTFDLHELADAAGCSTRHLRKVMNPDDSANLAEPKAAKICNYCGQYDELRPTYAFVPAGKKVVDEEYGQADGCVRDDIVEMTHVLSSIDHSYFKDRDIDELRKDISDAENVLSDLRAEVNALEGRSRG